MISCILKEKIVDRSEQGQPHKKRIPNGSQIRQFCRYLRKNRVINELTKILGQSPTFLEVAPNIVEWKPIFQGTLTCFCGKTPKNSDFNRLVPFEYQGPTLRCLTLKFRNLAQLWIRFSWDCSGATKSRVFFLAVLVLWWGYWFCIWKVHSGSFIYIASAKSGQTKCMIQMKLTRRNARN